VQRRSPDRCSRPASRIERRKEAAVHEQSIDRSEATQLGRIVDGMTYVDIEPVDTTAWATLTKAERTLSALVAKGMTNRQVAERLFISRHTVDAHLRHIFLKLGINSRVGLAHLVALHAVTQATSNP
jgi:DNA-binding CsgD family transcriptional regulator